MKLIYNVVQQFEIVDNGTPKLISTNIEVVERIERIDVIENLYSLAQEWMEKNTPFESHSKKSYTGYVSSYTPGRKYELILTPLVRSLKVSSPLFSDREKRDRQFSYAKQVSVKTKEELVFILSELFGV